MPSLATANEAEDILLRCREDPAWFLTEVLGDEAWSAQIEILEALRDHREVAVKSCHSIGKDWISARALLWFLYCYTPSMVISTGPTDRQVKEILWREVAKAHSRSRWPLGGKCQIQQLKVDEDRFAIGFTTTDEAERIAGFHSENILVILDEASGLQSQNYDAIEGVLASGNTKKLSIGNPTDSTSAFAKEFVTPGIHKISVDAFETPNFTAFGITQKDIEQDTWQEKITGPIPRPYLIMPEWVSQRFKRWGPSSPWYISRILAQFPVAGEDTLIPMAWIEAAQNRTLEPSEPNNLGVDVARFGPDKTVIAHRRGPVLRIRSSYGKLDTMETAGHVRLAWRETGATPIVDVIGIGAGVVDKLRELRVPVMEANAAASPEDKTRFLNARAEWFWTVRRELEIGNLDLDPIDEDLASELASLKWKPQSGKIKIESKEEMKKRGLASPDYADAAAHTFAGQSEYLLKYQKAMENI